MKITLALKLVTTTVLQLEPEAPSKTVVNGHPPLAILPRRDSEEERTVTRVRFNLHPTVVRRDSGAGNYSVFLTKVCHLFNQAITPNFLARP